MNQVRSALNGLSGYGWVHGCIHVRVRVPQTFMAHSRLIDWLDPTLVLHSSKLLVIVAVTSNTEGGRISSPYHLCNSPATIPEDVYNWIYWSFALFTSSGNAAL